MQFLEFLSLLQKTWTIIREFWNFFLFSKNVDYHMQFLEFLSLFQKRGLSYAISRNSFPFPKTWTIVCNFFPCSKNLDYHMQFLECLSLLQKTWTIICEFWNFFLFSKNVDYHMQFLEFLSLFQKRGLSYKISRICFCSPKSWTII